MSKNNCQATGALCRPLMQCVMYIIQIVYNTLCIVTSIQQNHICYLLFILYFNQLLLPPCYYTVGQKSI